jgi:hypothetical protein
MKCPICLKDCNKVEVEVTGKKAQGEIQDAIYLVDMYVCPIHNLNGASENRRLKSGTV